MVGITDMLLEFFFITSSQSTSSTCLRQIVILFCGLADILYVAAAQIVFIKIRTIYNFRYFDIKIANMTFGYISAAHLITFSCSIIVY